MKSKYLTVKNMTLIATLACLSTILSILNFPLPIFPIFYEIDISDVVTLIGTFALGPIPGLFIQLIKILLNLLLNGTKTMFIGELSNLVIGSVWIYFAGIIYYKDKTRRNAIKALIISSIIMIIVATLINYYIILDIYSYFLNISLESLISMGTTIIPIIDSKLSFVLFATLPFNTLKAIITSIILITIYKPISILIKKYQ